MLETLCLILALALHAACADAQCMRSGSGCDKESLGADGNRRLTALAPNSTLEMYVRPSWAMWSKLDFVEGYADGIFDMQQFWSSSADNYFSASDASEVVQIRNFNGGTSGRVSQPIIQTRSMYEIYRQFVGIFKQSFDATCYPYDHQDVEFDVTISRPASAYWTMYLLCNEGETAKDSQGNVVHHSGGIDGNLKTNIHTCTKTLGTDSVGMTWDELVCTRSSSSSITCKMRGKRSNTRIIINFLLPAIMVTAMSFGSFFLPVDLAMPRIATTMIAMLTLVNLRNSLSHNLPGSGNLSWVEKYFMITAIFTFLNLCCHVAAIGLHKRKFLILSEFVDQFGSEVSFCLSIILPFLLLTTSNCVDEGVEPTIAIVFGFLLLLIVIIKAFRSKWDAIKAWRADTESALSLKPFAWGQS